MSWTSRMVKLHLCVLQYKYGFIKNNSRCTYSTVKAIKHSCPAMERVAQCSQVDTDTPLHQFNIGTVKTQHKHTQHTSRQHVVVSTDLRVRSRSCLTAHPLSYIPTELSDPLLFSHFKTLKKLEEFSGLQSDLFRDNGAFGLFLA